MDREMERETETQRCPERERERERERDGEKEIEREREREMVRKVASMNPVVMGTCLRRLRMTVRRGTRTTALLWPRGHLRAS